MNANEYQKAASRTLLSAPDSEYTDQQIMLVWCGVGLAGEAGEVNELIKKHVFHRHDYDRAKLVKELGDCLWYLSGVATTMGISLDEIMQTNIDKLLKRYENGYSSQASRERVE